MSAQSYPPPSSNLSYKVELSISCSHLKNLDSFSKSDPAVFLYCRGREVDWKLVGRTEVIENNLNPKFSTTLSLEYRFEEVQNLQFSVFDIDDKQHADNIDKQELIGTVECTLAEIMAAGEHLTKTLNDLHGKPGGKITIRAEEVRDAKFVVNFELSATHLEKKDLFGKSDPYIEIAKSQEGGEFTVVYRSQPIMKTLNPRWPGFQVDIQKLCSGDWERTLQFSVWDWNKSGNNELIGLATTSLKDICPERGGKVFNLELTNPSHKGKKKSSGELVFNSVKVASIDSFVDYIRGGCQISLIVAVDFTASNGNPSDPNCLHYIHPTKDNEYVQALKSVASVLAPYDSDQMIPAFGFGGQIPPHFNVSHCFPLDLNSHNPEVNGVQGILNAYQHAVRTVRLCGPTNFAPTLEKAMQYASVRDTQQSQSYYILLIITDGEITDMGDTVDRIVAASRLPLSIVIVGVGGADFRNMEILDADDRPLKSRGGQQMARDIVQFVPFRDLMSRAGPNGCVAKETLAEIPGQLMAFMKANNIKPNPPVLRRSETTVYGQPGGPQGSAPYPPQGPAPYPPQGPAPYPPQGPAPYPPQGPAPYPPQGPAPYPPQGPAPYPRQGPAPYPPQGPAPYPPQGPAPYPPQGPAPYPPQGPAPYPPQGPAPYPPQGPAPYPPQGPAPYPPQGPAPYSSQGPTPYPPQGPAPYPPQGPAPTPIGPQGPAPTPAGPQGPSPTLGGPQGPVPTSSGPQGPAATPTGPQGPVPTPTEPQGPAPTPTGPQGPAPTPTGPQGPAPTPTEPHGPAATPTGPQGPVPTPTEPQGPAPIPTGPQGPVPTPTGPQGPAPTPTGPQGPAPTPTELQGPAPTSTGPQGPALIPQESIPTPSGP